MDLELPRVQVLRTMESIKAPSAKMHPNETVSRLLLYGHVKILSEASEEGVCKEERTRYTKLQYCRSFCCLVGHILSAGIFGRYADSVSCAPSTAVLDVAKR